MDELQEEFEKLIDAVKKSHKFCPWTKKETLDSYYKHILSEAQEIKEAVEKKDYENLKGELGDAIWDALMMAQIAENNGHFKVAEVLKSIVDKMKRRKPYIFEGRTVTIEEAWRIWKEVKAKEKSAGQATPLP